MPDPQITALEAEAARLKERAASTRARARRAPNLAMEQAEMREADQLDSRAAAKRGTARTLDAQRKKDLSKIHLAKKNLAMTDDAYRALVRRVTGGATDSAGNATAPQRRAILAEFRRFGWKPKRPKPAGDNPQVDKIRALWGELKTLGALRNPTEKALNGYCKRMTGVDRVDWLDGAQASRVIEALKQWIKRVEDN